jgi:hypothetical protein
VTWWREFWTALAGLTGRDHCRFCTIRAREIRRLRARLALYERTVTTGGPPRPCQPLGAWKPVTTTPPSADDTTAPPLQRRRTR